MPPPILRPADQLIQARKSIRVLRSGRRCGRPPPWWRRCIWSGRDRPRKTLADSARSGPRPMPLVRRP